VRRTDGLLRENEYDNPCFVDGVNDLVGIQRTGDYVPGSDPALDAVALESFDDGIRNRRILRRIADEDVAGCVGEPRRRRRISGRLAPAGLPPDTLASCDRMRGRSPARNLRLLPAYCVIPAST